MKAFRNKQRIVVSSPCQKNAQLKGAPGVVRRLLFRDDSAWVEMVNGLPEELRIFHDAYDPRLNHIVLFPEECEERK
jgi:hypothetical protein